MTPSVVTNNEVVFTKSEQMDNAPPQPYMSVTSKYSLSLNEIQCSPNWPHKTKGNTLPSGTRNVICIYTSEGSYILSGLFSLGLLVEPETSCNAGSGS